MYDLKIIRFGPNFKDAKILLDIFLSPFLESLILHIVIHFQIQRRVQFEADMHVSIKQNDSFEGDHKVLDEIRAPVTSYLTIQHINQVIDTDDL